MNTDNVNKSTSGSKQNEILLNIAETAKLLKYIREYHYRYSISKPGYKWEHQFYCPCLIEFYDNEKWLLYTSTSYRQDRAKEWFWDSLFTKELTGAKYSFLIYAESTKEKEKKIFLRWKQRFLKKDGYYTIDDILSESELDRLIQQKGSEYFDQGFFRSIRGNAFEEKVAEVLENEDNLSIFLTDNHVLRGNYYSLFSGILSKCKYSNKSSIKRIEATSNNSVIGRLPSGGLPKTDVLATVYTNDDSKEFITISCKQSDASKVSVHQYKADTFADVLDKNNPQLRSLLRDFQANPTLSEFGSEKGTLLAETLNPYLRKLTLWVICGRFGEGKKQQLADYILIYSDLGYSIYTAEEYCDKLLKTSKGNFGTPFFWTYASKQRGKSIQLKCRLL